jgi:hypothetical protein
VVKYADLALFVNLTAEQRVNLPPLKGQIAMAATHNRPKAILPDHPMNNNTIPLPPLKIP